MIPILYEATETAFATQGLGALGDAISVTIARVLNGKDELVMVYPNTGIRYADLLNDRIIYAQPEYRKSAQPYQIYQITKPMNGRVTVYARHVGTQRTKYIPVTAFTAASASDVMYKLPLNLGEANPFTFWTNKNTSADFKLKRPASLGNVLGGMEGSILDVYGGEYEFDGYTIKLWDHRGADNGVELRYGKNITDIEQSEDFAPIITGVCPYWEGMEGGVVSLPEVVVQGAYADTYSFRRTIVKDFTDQFEETPSVADLRAAATAYISDNSLGVPEINLRVNFEHLAQYEGYEGIPLLETTNLGDTVHIYYEPLDVAASARIVNTTYDCLNEKYISVQVGNVKSDLAQVMNKIGRTTTQLKETLAQSVPSAIAGAVSHATDLITGANGGYVVMNRDANGYPYEILIMDTDNPATATNVLRLNQNGIGFSTTGYSGPYSTAWTIEGSFVADYIVTGNLNASLVTVGVLKDAANKNSWNMVTGAFTITDGTLNITTQADQTNVISLNYTDCSTTVQPYGVRAEDLTNSTANWVNRLAIGTYKKIGTTYYPTAYLSGSQLKLGGTNALAPSGGELQIYDTNQRSRSVVDSSGVSLSNSSGTTTMTIGSAYGTVSIYGSPQTATISSDSIYYYNGTNKFTYLMWPDSNGAGRIILGDGTSTYWRTSLTNNGLTFTDSSGTQTATYPAGGLSEMQGTTIVANVASGTDTKVASVTLDAGKWVIFAFVGFDNNSAGSRFISITSSSSSATTGVVASDSRNPATGRATRISIVGYAKPTAQTTYYLWAAQYSGSTLSLSPLSMYAIKLP